MKYTKVLLAVLVAVSFFTIVSKDVHAASPFYKGKTITWVVTGAGSTTDLKARAIGTFLKAETGANVIIKNMRTEAGGNFVWTSRPDGLTMGSNSTGSLLAMDILKAPGTLYKVDEFNWIADLDPGYRAIGITPGSKLNTLQAMKSGKGLKFAAAQARGALHSTAAVLIEVMGLDAKVITGYNGTAEAVLAVAKGETDFLISSDATIAKADKNDLMKPLFIMGSKKSLMLPNLPTLVEFGVTIPKELQAVYEFVILSGTGLVMPPGVPKDRVEYMRSTIMKLSSNNKLRQSLAKIHGVSLEAVSAFIPGEEIQKTVDTMKADKELGNRVATLSDKYLAAK